MLISVIVPTFNDQAHLPVTLRQLAEQPDIELIVVDGGSSDLSADIARQATPYVFVSHPHRARQLNEGARHATGDILLFLHPGSFLLPGALLEIQRRMIAASAVGGAFDLHFDSPRPILRWLGRSYSARARFWRLPRGEQALFVWRQVFQKIGGFPDVPILEGIAFARRLRRAGRLTFIREGLVASAHRWHRHGALKTALADACLNTLAMFRIPPRRLRRLYDGWMRPKPAFAGPITSPASHRPKVVRAHTAREGQDGKCGPSHR
jgi:rSAM/selenodomain-associated transferase 2